jgi:hypothetical protein
VLTVPPYPFVLEDPSNVPFEECWVVRPQLFLTCHPAETHGRTVAQSQSHLRRGYHLRLTYGEARMISKSRWYSTAPSNSWTCPVLDLWKGGLAFTCISANLGKICCLMEILFLFFACNKRYFSLLFSSFSLPSWTCWLIISVKSTAFTEIN